ncbi:MAG: tetratricopeptide repeat protein [Ignavibacteriota bacterium]
MTRLEKLQEFLKNDPADSFTRYAIALEYRAMQDILKAIEIFEALVISDPAYVATYYQLADCYRQLKEASKARTCYQKGILVARSAQDLHAASELQMAMDELDDEE